MTSNLLRAMVMTYSHAKVQGQRSVGSEYMYSGNGQMDGCDCITSLTNPVGNQGVATTMSVGTLAYVP